MAHRLIQIPYDGKKYDFLETDITSSRLIQFQEWYGEDYGGYSTFVLKVLRLDAAAVMCALWVAKSNAGEPCDIRTLDIDMSAVAHLVQDNAEAEAKKTAAAEAKKRAAGSGPTKAKAAQGTTTPD
jgi:hypothetical protein